MSKYFYKYVNGDKWIQINGEGNDPKNCKINWESSKDNEDMFTILTQEKVISPLCGWVKCNNPKFKNNIYIQVLKISPLIKDGYICKKYNVPHIEPPLPDPQIIIPEKEEEIETKKILINKSELLKVERSHKGLVLRDVTVKRGGKTFTQKRWVKAGEDEPEPKKSKGVGEKISLDIFTVGDEISMMGEALTIEKIDVNEKTIKMSDGKVYTLKAAKLYSKPLSKIKYKVNDKIIFNDEEKTIVKINRGLGLAEFEDGTMHSFDDIEMFTSEPKKETKIKDLKPIEKKPKPKKEKEIRRSIPIDKESKVIKGTAKDGSLTSKERKLADKKLQKFIKELDEKEKVENVAQFDKISKSPSVYTAGNSFSYNAYLLSNRKMGFDYETRGITKISKDEREWYEKKVKMLDKFLDDAPKVETTSYRGMYWDLNDPNSKRLYDDFISEMTPGNIIESKAYSSTTVSKKTLAHYGADRSGGDIVAHIEYETKSGVYIASESGNPEQQEVLLPHHMKFEVVEVKSKEADKFITIKLREVN